MPETKTGCRTTLTVPKGYTTCTRFCSLCRYKSTDSGRTFGPPSTIGRWGHETNVAVLTPSHYLATIRYQPLVEQLAAQGDGDVSPDEHAEQLRRNGQVSKVVFVSESLNSGRTWSRNRQVTTGGGQCHAHAVGLQGGSVVMVTDHRYPRRESGARAFVSHDSGRRWEEEVYYLSSGIVAGFARTVRLDNQGTMLTLTGYCNPRGGFDAWQGEEDT